MLTVDDLYSDKVILRRIKRHERGGNSSDVDDGELPGATQLEEIIDDSSAVDIDSFGVGARASVARRSAAPKVKDEEGRLRTGYSSSGAVILDLEGGSEKSD